MTAFLVFLLKVGTSQNTELCAVNDVMNMQPHVLVSVIGMCLEGCMCMGVDTCMGWDT